MLSGLQPQNARLEPKPQPALSRSADPLFRLCLSPGGGGDGGGGTNGAACLHDPVLWSVRELELGPGDEIDYCQLVTGWPDES